MHNIGPHSHFPWAKLANLLRQKKAAFIASNGHRILESLGESKTKRHFCNNEACHYFTHGFCRKVRASKHIQSKTSCAHFGFGQDVALVEKYTTPDGKEKLNRTAFWARAGHPGYPSWTSGLHLEYMQVQLGYIHTPPPTSPHCNRHT